MKRLEIMFGDEREVKVAQGLLGFLCHISEPTRLVPLMRDSLPRIMGLTGVSAEEVLNTDYERILAQLRRDGYIKTSTGHLSINTEAVMTPEAKEFYEKNYASNQNG